MIFTCYMKTVLIKMLGKKNFLQKSSNQKLSLIIYFSEAKSESVKNFTSNISHLSHSSYDLNLTTSLCHSFLFLSIPFYFLFEARV